MKRNKKWIMRTAIVVIAILCLFSVPVHAAKKTASVKKVTLNYKTITLKKGKQVTLKATVTPKKVKKQITWKSANTKVATVNSKGVVKAVKVGKTNITATVKGTKKKAVCKVIVGTPVTKVTLSKKEITLAAGATKQAQAGVKPKNASNKSLTYKSENTKIATVSAKGLVKGIKGGSTRIKVTAADGSKKSAYIKVRVTQKISVSSVNMSQAKVTVEKGNSAVLKATVLPENASNKGVTWKSSNTKIATVDAQGKVRALQWGNATITATTKDGNKTANCQVQVPSIIRVDSQEQLLEALKQNPSILTLVTSGAIRFTIPQGNYEQTELIIDAPNATVENNAKFSKVIAQNIRTGRYLEKSTNSIYSRSTEGTIEVDMTAQVNIVIENGVNNTNIENDGKILSLQIDTSATVEITGGAQDPDQIPVEATGNASNARLVSNQKVHVRARRRLQIVLNAGAEESKVTVDIEQNIPDVSGLGSIPVYVESTEEEEIIVADNNGNATENVTLEGILQDAETGAAIQEADIYLIPYKNNLNLASLDAYLRGVKQGISDSFGMYSMDSVTIGNYIMLIRKTGYHDIIQTLVITSVNRELYSNELSRFISNEDQDTGSISGTIINAATGDPIEFQVRLRIRAGNNNLSGTYLQEIFTDEYGNYYFDNLKPGNYTIQILSTKGTDKTEVITSGFNVIVLPGRETSNQDSVASQTVQQGQFRFVLRWGNEESGAPSDLDSHLCGPTSDGASEFHTYYGNRYYYNENEEVGAFLDVDDTSWEGPETTTVYGRTKGEYRFYVHDFSNSESSNSYELSKSQAFVQVFEGNTLRQTFYVPQNKQGTLWAVCKYNAVTGVITPVNEITNWNGSTSEIGLNPVNIYKNRLLELINDMGNYMSDVEVGTEKTRVMQEIEAARAIYRNSQSEEELSAAITKLEQLYEKTRDEFAIYEITGNAVENWYKNDNEITIYGFEEELGTVQVTCADSSSQVKIENTSIDGYVKLVTITTSSGLVKKWYIRYYLDDSKVRILGVSDGDNILTDLYIDHWGSVGYVELRGINERLSSQFEVSVDSEASYIITNSTETGYVKEITVTWRSLSKKYYVSYEQDQNPLLITGFSDDYNEIYSVTIDHNKREIVVYGSNDTLNNTFQLQTFGNIAYEIEDQGSRWADIIVYDRDNEDNYRYYYLYYYIQDNPALTISGIIDSDGLLEDYYIYNSDIEIYASNISVLNTITPVIQAGSSWKMIHPEDEEWDDYNAYGQDAIILVSKDNSKRAYYVYFYYD